MLKVVGLHWLMLHNSGKELHYSHIPDACISLSDRSNFLNVYRRTNSGMEKK